MKPICIFHSIDGKSHCDDGFASAYAVWRALGDKCEYHPGVYQTDPPDVKNREVIIVDFSYKKPVIERMAQQAEKILILDHHKSAAEDLLSFTFGQPNSYPNVEAIFDIDHSGAFLAWKYFNPSKNIPPLLLHIQDRDLWRFEIEGTMLISMALRSYPQSFEVWDNLMWKADRLKDEGAAIHRCFRQQIDNLKNAVIKKVIGGYSVPTVNAPLVFASDLAGELANDAPFAAVWYDLPQGRVYSLRSGNGGIDVSQVAAQYGGGGHRNAAGFKLPHDKSF